jgi:hypothetical protein
MTKKLFLVVALSHSLFSLKGQIEKFVYDISDDKRNIDLTKLISLLPLDSSKNIIVLSESDHQHKSSDLLRAILIDSLYSGRRIDFCFFEWPFVDYYVFNLLDKLGIAVDSVLKYNTEVLKFDLHAYDTSIINRDYKFFHKNPVVNIKAKNTLFPLDIGTVQQQFSISALGYLTKHSAPGNLFVNKTVDSLVVNHQQLFNMALAQEVSDSTCSHFSWTANLFLTELKKDSRYDHMLVMAWENLINEFFHKCCQGADYLAYKSDQSFKSFAKYQNFRDSLMFNNLETALSKVPDWRNAIISVSSLHAISNYKTKNELSGFLSSDYTTLGERLEDKYNTLIKKIVLICYRCVPENTGQKKVRKKVDKSTSLENQLSKKYKFAYISLSDMRKDPGMKRYQFYFRPTFEEPVRSDWQNVFDGAIFIRDCDCSQ